MAAIMVAELVGKKGTEKDFNWMWEDLTVINVDEESEIRTIDHSINRIIFNWSLSNCLNKSPI